MLSEKIKVDIAIIPSLVSSDGTTSAYFSMKDYDHALFVWSVAGLGILLTSVGTVYQAKDASAATSAAGLASTTAIMTQYTKATSFTITPATLSAGNSVTITSYNAVGVAETARTYTATAAGSAGASEGYVFNINDTASGTGIVSTACTNLAAILNNTTYGLLHAYASASSTAVTVRSMQPGDSTFTITSNNTTNLTLSVDQAIGMIEVDAKALTSSSNFTHVALNVVNQSAVYTAAFILRGDVSRQNYAQAVNVLTQV